MTEPPELREARTLDAVCQRYSCLPSELADSLGIEIRRIPIGGRGGTLCAIKGRRVLFLDTDADRATQYDRVLRELAQVPEIDSIYLRPEVREDLDRIAANQ